MKKNIFTASTATLPHSTSRGKIPQKPHSCPTATHPHNSFLNILTENSSNQPSKESQELKVSKGFT
jgi:hypothetical protein